MVVWGATSAAATSIAIGTHQPGDLIIIAARGTAAAPVVPSAGGTVPAWTTLQSGIANAIGLTVVAFVATASNHTSGTWTSATHICVLVLRPDAGKQLSTTAARSSVANANNTQTIVYPSLTVSKTDGTSWCIRCGTRTVAVTAVGTAPTNYGNLIVQPAGASALMAVHSRSGIFTNQTQDSVSTAGTNAPYRAVTVEVLESVLITNLPISGVGSAVMFGAVAITAVIARAVAGVASAQAFGPIPQTVVVAGVPPPTYDLHISGEYLAGQALVGWTGGTQFGTPIVQITTARDVLVGGIASAQAFGTPTIRAVARIVPNGVASAQAFGVVTTQTVVRPTIGGVSSAQAFGAPTIRTAITRTVTGLGSAQAFGTIKTAFIRPVTGVGSAQAFGTPRMANVAAVAGIPSAQAFGIPTIYALRKVTVSGLASAQAFGSPTVKITAGISQIVPVSGLFPWDANVAGRYLAGQAVVGGIGIDPFGRVTFKLGVVAVPVGGVSSAQAFGTPLFWKRYVVPGVDSAQAFGEPFVYRAYAHPTVPTVPVGETLVPTSAYSVILEAAACTEIVLSPNVCTDVTLTPSDSTEIVLEPAEVS